MFKPTFALIAAICFTLCAGGSFAAAIAPLGQPSPTLAMSAKPKPDGKMCGGIAGFKCKNSGDYCHYADGACRTIADAAGVCTPKPEVCTMIYAPVCGCDGKTYSSSCVAAGAGVSVASQGECKPQ